MYVKFIACNTIIHVCIFVTYLNNVNTLGTRVKHWQKGKADLDKCDTNKMLKLNNIWVKWMQLKVFFQIHFTYVI